MSNQRFYIVKICVPDFLIFIPLFLKKELLIHSDCPKNHLPMFLVIDRENDKENIICLLHEYAIDKANKLNNEHPNSKICLSPKINCRLRLKKDRINKKIIFGLGETKADDNQYGDIDIKNLLNIYLQSFVDFVQAQTPEYLNDITAEEYISNTVNFLKEQKEINSIFTDKKEITDYLPTIDEMTNSDTKKFKNH
ncbi:hypothetical protein H0539_004121 [Salmonella enterica]|nr:hypothetical protein [Salmonella enterica]EGB1974736.1 hypothetical protein [Salmonella enterica]